MSESSNAFNLDLALSSLHADGGDIQLMFRLLLERLSVALGDRLRVERAGRLRKDGRIRRVDIQLSGMSLIAELHDGAPQFLIARVSGGIRIRTDVTDVAGWLKMLLDALNTESEHSAITRQALETIIIGGD
ncbi:MAG TPA: hypothetical protein VMU99_07310 [Acidimicrobiales bacterium]|nr:hypothetical protein [Acidimicrobiales bacterium]